MDHGSIIGLLTSHVLWGPITLLLEPSPSPTTSASPPSSPSAPTSKRHVEQGTRVSSCARRTMTFRVTASDISREHKSDETQLQLCL